MSSNKYHKMAIDIIANNDAGALIKICVDIAKHNPANFVKAAERAIGYVYKEQQLPLAKRAAKLVKQRKKILAIKLVRAETGMNLKEAKDYVDSLQQEASK